jgi:Tol biopolymer transport system component
MTKTRIALITIVLLAITAAALAGYLRYQQKQGRTTPPPPGAPLDLHKVSNGMTLPGGFMVWSSNRFGNHDILLMRLPDRQIRRLTTHPHTEYFPRISPDGKSIVFSRSHQPWVSQRKQEPWDVILLDLATGEERMLAKNGNTPTWSADGRKVYFQRDAVKFVEIDVDSGIEKVLFTSGSGDTRPKTVLQTPQYNSRRDRIAVTLRGAQRAAGTLDLKGDFNSLSVSDGCQISWNRNGDFLYFIDHGGRMKNVIYRHDLKQGQSRLWLDLPGDYSHEYFPRLSNDENYLVFGASAKGHEHDSADYEMFLWRVGSPASSATRLTFHTGNDNWPDLYITTK